MLNNIDLVEEYERVEDTECGVVENARENNVLEILEAVCVVDLPFYVVVLDLHNFLKFGLIVEVLSVVGFVQGKVWVVCVMSAKPCASRVGQGLHSSAPTTPRTTGSVTTYSMMAVSFRRMSIFMMLHSR